MDAVDFALRRMAAWLLTVRTALMLHCCCTQLRFSGNHYAQPYNMPYSLQLLDSRCDVISCCRQGHGGPKHQTAHGRAAGAATLSYFRNRASSPRDMSAAAAAEMRKACDAVLQDTY